MKHGPLQWRTQSEMIRSGRNRRFGKLIPPQDIDGMIRQLRDKNKLEEGGKRVSGDFGASTNNDGVTDCANGASTQTNPVLHNAHEGFGRFDFTRSESRSPQLYYATDEWADGEDSDGKDVCDMGEDEIKDGPGTWYRAREDVSQHASNNSC